MNDTVGCVCDLSASQAPLSVPLTVTTDERRRQAIEEASRAAQAAREGLERVEAEVTGCERDFEGARTDIMRLAE